MKTQKRRVLAPQQHLWKCMKSRQMADFGRNVCTSLHMQVGGYMRSDILQLPHITSNFLLVARVIMFLLVHTSTSSLWTHFFCNSEVWPQELSIALRQVILGCFQNNWPRAWWEKALFLSAQKWQPEIYLKVVLLTWNFGSRPKIDFYDHIIF